MTDIQIEALAELERVQKREAAMREALERCSRSWRWYVNNPAAPIAGITSMDAAIVACEAALSTDAGKAYVPLEDVKPLVEALEYYTRATRKESSHLPPHRTWQGDDGLTARNALAHAHEKGLA